MSQLKDLVKDRTVSFAYYLDGSLWYNVDGTDFIFPVPIDDIGTAIFRAHDKAILFMRYIRKHIAMIEKARDENAAHIISEGDSRLRDSKNG